MTAEEIGAWVAGVSLAVSTTASGLCMLLPKAKDPKSAYGRFRGILNKLAMNAKNAKSD